MRNSIGDHEPSRSLNHKPLPLGPIFSGMFGGMVVAVVAALIVVTVGLGFSTKRVTVQESPIVPVAGPQKSRQLTARQIYRRDALGVVFINATDVNQGQSSSEYLKGEGGQLGTATGSGFEIDGDGTILTNWHVIENAGKVIVGFERGKSIEAKIIGKDPSNDLAVLRIPVEGLTLHPLTLGDSERAQVGDPALAIGNPFGLGRTLTTGVVSALQRRIQAPSGVTINNAVQTDAPINPGNSGGPLLDEQGQVIGINSQIESGSSEGGNVGIAFAIPINNAKSELSTLEIGGIAYGTSR